MRFADRLTLVVIVLAALSVLNVAGCARPIGSKHDTPLHPRAAAAAHLTTAGLTARNMPPHPFMLFNQSDIPALAKRRTRDPLLEECWTRLATLANRPDVLDDTPDEKTDRGNKTEWWQQLEACAFIGRIGNDPAMSAKAISLLQRVIQERDPDEFYTDDTDFQAQAAPLRSLALAWDWLYQDMTPQQRAAVLPGLEHWCQASFTYTNKQWWREASYNVGAIPVGGIGTLALAIHSDSDHPQAAMWLREAARRLGQNYYPTTFKASGICYEGPNYSIVGLRYPAMFSEALRRAGGEDQLGRSGALHTMQYQMHQWMPQNACAPIGDNTNYGRRTFAAEYLLGIARTRDAVGLWTWRNYTDARHLDRLVTYLWYPLDLKPLSPTDAKVPAAKYFEVTENRAGYFFSRTKWNDPDAAFFAFVTRFERCNHEHYDMNSFLLGGFGTLFATHECIFPYGHENCGVDFEHNMIIIDEGGWPRHDTGSCGDNNSMDGVLTGLATGPFADYTRGDAKWSYRDNSIIISNPAIRAERACLFVKAGSTPYMLAFDDNQFSDDSHDYRWQWYAPSDVAISGAGTTSDPIVLAAKKGSCALQFLTPAAPAVTIGKIKLLGHDVRKPAGATQPADAPASRPIATTQPAEATPIADAAASRPLATTQPGRNPDRRRDAFLQRIDVTQNGSRVHYVAIATLQQDLAARPTIQAQPVTCENDSAGAAQIRLADGSTDQIAWQPEEVYEQRGSDLQAGQMQTDGLMALVRVNQAGRIVGYVLGEGTYLKWGDKVLVQAKGSVCVTADADGVKLFGQQQSRKGLSPTKPVGAKTYKPLAR